MPDAHIYQIYYSERTRDSRDKGFLGLDNLRNERPDWREYWPIRHFLLGHDLNEDDYYGFFSPKFAEKTTLDSVDVHEFIRHHAGNADVVLLSPFFDQGAFAINMFEQGAMHHSGIWEVFQESVAIVAPGIDCKTLVMDSRNTVFCNYFVAKPKFWRHWLDKCEVIFNIAEERTSKLAQMLNASTNHDDGSATNKVFVIERIASLLLATEPGWKVKAYNPLSLPFSPDPIARFKRELILLDSLKVESATQGGPQHMELYSRIREGMARMHEGRHRDVRPVATLPEYSRFRLGANRVEVAKTREKAGVTPVSQPHIINDTMSSPAVLGKGLVFKVDRSILVDGFALVFGWCTKGLEIDSEFIEKIVFFGRQDVEVQLGNSVTGFALAGEVGDNISTLDVKLTKQEVDYSLRVTLHRDPQAIAQTLNEQKSRIASLIDPLARSLKWATLFSKMVAPPASSSQAAAAIEEGKLAHGIGGMVLGWAYARERCELWLVSGETHWRPLTQAIRYFRSDIIEAFPHESSYTQEAGFICAIAGDVKAEDCLRVVAATPEGLSELCSTNWVAGPRSPKEFSRQIFDFPTPYGEFVRRLELHDGPILEELIATAQAGLEPEPTVFTLGEAEAPIASVIVPLYGRADFIQHQLLRFSADQDFIQGRIELIYVIDDVRLYEYVRANVHFWSERYRIPFKVVWGGRNRGFSGANNFGRKFATTEVLIFLNSDVFPLTAGWASSMVNELRKKRDVGAVGVRLEYPDGAVQHLGMDFVWDEELELWLNEHPYQGLLIPPAMGKQRIDVPALTGACLGVRAKDYDEVNGFDESYLIGDFEDSDLCLKLTAGGRRCVVLADTRLVHLVRQSFAGTGDTSYRQRVVLYNAWLHSRRWGQTIQAIKDKANVKAS